MIELEVVDGDEVTPVAPPADKLQGRIREQEWRAPLEGIHVTLVVGL